MSTQISSPKQLTQPFEVSLDVYFPLAAVLVNVINAANAVRFPQGFQRKNVFLQ